MKPVTSQVSISLQCHTRTVHNSPKPGVAHYFRPTLTHTEGSAISCVYRHGSGPTLGGYDSPVSRLTVRHELTCRFATGLGLGGVIPCQLAPTRGCNPDVDSNPRTPVWESSALTTQPIRRSSLNPIHNYTTWI